jgi:ubiquinone/menaquinone biosynthesis C-methylase UbiE
MIAVDLSPGMMDQAMRKAQMLNSDVRFAFMDAQSLALQDESFDYVVATFVFCSVPDPVLGLMELGRVCKPDGFILLLEHVRSHLPVFGRVMDWLNPLAVRLTGANINRNTAENVRRAGLEILSIENLMMAGMVKLVTARPARDAG